MALLYLVFIKIMISPFVLHVRLTKDCNAGCSYCSSANATSNKPMTLPELKLSIIKVFDIWDNMDIKPTDVTLEYVGGEVTMLQMDNLEVMVQEVRSLFFEKNIRMIDGVQSNLLCSKRKLSRLFDLFDGRIGTSIDNWSDQRTFNGSSRKYRTFFMKSESHIDEEFAATIPAVITMDEFTMPHLVDEMKNADAIGRNLVFRPIFKGGKKVDILSSDGIAEAYIKLFDAWLYKSKITVDPLYTLLKRRINNRNNKNRPDDSFCSWSSDCAKKSLCIEPNGDLFVCQELADHKFGKIGNTLSDTVDYDLLRVLLERDQSIADSCGDCKFYLDCKGGCMVDSVQLGLSHLVKTPNCTSWKRLFGHMDDVINRDGARVERWLTLLEKRDGIKQTHS